MLVPMRLTEHNFFTGSAYEGTQRLVRHIPAKTKISVHCPGSQRIPQVDILA